LGFFFVARFVLRDFGVFYFQVLGWFLLVIVSANLFGGYYLLASGFACWRVTFFYSEKSNQKRRPQNSLPCGYPSIVNPHSVNS